MTNEPIRLHVSFQAPENTIIELQGPTLEAYKEWAEDPTMENEDELSDRIMEQCEDHVAMWTLLEEWDHA